MAFPTQEEIVARINERRADDMFGFEVSEYILWLDFKHAKQFLKDNAQEGDWPDPHAATTECVVEVIRNYMPFAWDKANNCRGISAWRSLAHMQAWLWLLGERAAINKLEKYDHYGKPHLRAICEKFGIDWQALDDGLWRNDESHPGKPPLPATNIFEE